MSPFPTQHPKNRTLRTFLACMALLTAFAVTSVSANDEKKAEDAVLLLAANHEPDGFDFRADIWVRELSPEVGKAVKIQLFKGNDYRVCIAVPKRSGVKIAAHVLDGNGKPIETVTEVTDDAWGLILHVKPARTGVYVVAIRNAGGDDKNTSVAMISGYK